MTFNKGFYAYAIIGHTRADQLLPQLLMEQFDTFPIQCRHIEHMHEGGWFSTQVNRMSRSRRVLAIGGKHCDLGRTGSVFIHLYFL